jgi:hypothetical protein
MTHPEPGEDGALLQRLRALREERPESAFRESLHRRLVAAGPPEPSGAWERIAAFCRRRAPILWPAVGVAAGVATFLLLSALQRPPSPVTSLAEVPGTTVPASKVAVIRLDFTADVAVEQADFQVSLPEGLQFWADGELLPHRSFEWTQPLQEGNNVIPVAVRGQRPGRYLVTAVARVGGQDIQHDVLLEVTEG